MFNKIGKLNYISSRKISSLINQKDLTNKVNCLDKFIVLKSKNKLKIYDRNCDHMGGKIISRNNIHECPVHKWKFNVLSGKYSNGITKKPIKNVKINGDKIIISEKNMIPSITKIMGKNDNIKIRFINHACLIVETDKFKFATDPWTIGPAFNTGWCLKSQSKIDWIEELNSCTFIYISHNHSDHLHPLTLSKINKNIPIVIPNFISGSTLKFINDLKFTKLIKLDFGNEYQLNDSNLVVSILKSGDFREDSGIYFSIGKFTALFDVDSNMINFNKIPHIDLYASSFAGGASGYPLCFENYSDKEKKEIIIKNKNFLKHKKIKTIIENKIKYFLPYAGFFQEKLDRDKKIYEYNKKNLIKDYELILNKKNIKILNVEKFDEFYFKSKKLIKSDINHNGYYEDLDKEIYLKFFKDNYSSIDKDYIKNYFLNSNFNENLILYIKLTDDDFKKNFFSFEVNFQEKITFKIIKNFKINEKNKKNFKKIYIRCRKESFLNTLYNKGSWEELLIGFQCRIKRYPNLYNAKFWNHFSNIYVAKKNVKITRECNSCETLMHFFDNQIQENNQLKKV